jgi:HEAT repeat protein
MLVDDLQNGMSTRRVVTVHALSQLGPLLTNVLTTGLQSRSEFTRRNAIEVLRETCDPKAISPLKELLNDYDYSIRFLAGEALREIEKPAVAQGEAI